MKQDYAGRRPRVWEAQVFVVVHVMMMVLWIALNDGDDDEDCGSWDYFYCCFVSVDLAAVVVVAAAASAAAAAAVPSFCAWLLVFCVARLERLPQSIVVPIHPLVIQ